MILNSIPQRLPRLQRVLNPFLRLAFAAKGLERLALEIQNILLADRSDRGHVAPQRTSATSVPSFTSYSVMYSPGRMRRTLNLRAGYLRIPNCNSTALSTAVTSEIGRASCRERV